MTAAASRRHLPPLAKIALELGPLVVFFVMNGRVGIIHSTAWFMAAVLVSLTAMWLLVRRVPLMPLVSCALVLVFGTLTVLLNDDTFIKLKPTIANLFFGGALLAGLALGRNLLDLVFDGVFRLTPEGWRTLTLRWAGFFFVLAALNEVLRLGFPTETWLAFKVWGVMPLSVLFALAQVPLLNRTSLPEPARG